MLRPGRSMGCSRWASWWTSSAAGAGLLAATGCTMIMDKVTPPDVAEVRLGEQSVHVSSGQDDDSRAGVRDLRVQNWEGAISALERSTATVTDEWRTLFALGVAYERTGRNSDALRAYEAANRLLKGAGKPEVTAGVIRMRALTPPR